MLEKKQQEFESAKDNSLWSLGRLGPFLDDFHDGVNDFTFIKFGALVDIDESLLSLISYFEVELFNFLEQKFDEREELTVHLSRSNFWPTDRCLEGQ